MDLEQNDSPCRAVQAGAIPKKEIFISSGPKNNPTFFGSLGASRVFESKAVTWNLYKFPLTKHDCRVSLLNLPHCLTILSF